MTSRLAQVLIGRTVTVVEVIEDYVQFNFGEDIGLTIYNNYEIPPSEPVSSICGHGIKKIIETKDKIRFIFDAVCIYQ